MTSKVRRVAIAIAYAVAGAVFFGGGGIAIGFSLAPDDGLQAVFNAAVGGLAGGLGGGILGVALFVAGTRALERQSESVESPQAQEAER